jgi:hypothetical protein
MQSALLHSIAHPLAALATLSFLFTPAAFSEEPAPDTASADIDAIWHGEQVAFEYQSTTTFYTCDELGRRLLEILKALGLHKNTSLGPACKGGLYSRRTRIDLVLVSPVAATPVNIERATTFNATDRLIAQVRGEPLPTANDIARFPARWQKIALTQDPGLRIRYQDCDLLKGMRDQLFPKLAIRVVPKSFRCDSLPSHIRPRIVVEALVAVAEPNET